MSYDNQELKPRGEIINTPKHPSFQERIDAILQDRIEQNERGLRTGSTNRNTIETMLLRRMSGKRNGDTSKQLKRKSLKKRNQKAYRKMCKR